MATPFILTSQDSSTGTTSTQYQTIIEVISGPAELREIGLSADSFTRWRILGLGEPFTMLPDLPISFPVFGSVDFLRIEAQSIDGTQIYPTAYISGGYS